MRLERFSQDGEDRMLWAKYFPWVARGTFLEMGALDGVLHSNLLFFERNFGWTGVLIEGSRDNYLKLEQNRPKSVNIHRVICDRRMNVHFVEGFPAVRGIWEFMAQSFRDQFHKNVRVSDLQAVKCEPLSVILDKISTSHFDFFSLRGRRRVGRVADVSI